MNNLTSKNSNRTTGKPLADTRTATKAQADTKNHYFDDGKAIEGGFVVPIGFYNSVKSQCIAILPYLSAAAQYDAVALYGEAYWDGLQPCEQRLLDACLKTLIAERDVPLEVDLPSGSFPVFYQLVLGHETLVTRSTDIGL